MKIQISREQAERLKFEQYPDFIRACFYLGIGMLEMRQIIDDPFSEAVIEATIDAAIDMGMDETDIVYIREKT